jgi:hypothetical protein
MVSDSYHARPPVGGERSQAFAGIGRGGVPARDGAGQVLTEDGIAGDFDDLAEQSWFAYERGDTDSGRFFGEVGCWMSAHVGAIWE